MTGNASNPPFATTVALPNTVPTTQLFNATDPGHAAPGSTVSPSSVDPGFDTAYVQSWNLNVQREVMSGLAVTVGYFGSKGTHLRQSRNLNQTFLNAALVVTRPFPALSASSPISPGVPSAEHHEPRGHRHFELQCALGNRHQAPVAKVFNSTLRTHFRSRLTTARKAPRE